MPGASHRLEGAGRLLCGTCGAAARGTAGPERIRSDLLRGASGEVEPVSGGSKKQRGGGRSQRVVALFLRPGCSSARFARSPRARLRPALADETKRPRDPHAPVLHVHTRWLRQLPSCCCLIKIWITVRATNPDCTVSLNQIIIKKVVSS